MNTKVQTIAIRKDSNGKVVEVLEVKTISTELIAEMKAEVKNNECLQAKNKKGEEDVAIEEASKKARLTKIRNIFIAKTYFDGLVDSGKTETNEQFERMFERFIVGGIYDDTYAPIKFKEILGRLEK